MEAGRRILPTCFFKLSCRQSEACSLSLGLLLYELSQAPLVESKELRPPVGWFFNPLNVWPDPLHGLFDWVWHCAVCEWVLPSCRLSRWGGTGLGCGSCGSCRSPLVTISPWQSHLRSYQRGYGHRDRWTLVHHITHLWHLQAIWGSKPS